MDKDVSAIVKWVGGKRLLKDIIISHFPKDFKNYFEPFVGGGSIFIELKNRDMLKHKIYLNDSNYDLINLYTQIRDNYKEFIEKLKEQDLYINYINLYKIDYKKAFYKIRDIDKDKSFKYFNPTQRAVRFLFLSKYGFNGLIRYNSKGQLNMSAGSYDILPILTKPYKENLDMFKSYLEGVELSMEDYKSILSKVGKKDIIYLDPPYMPISKTSNFTKYTKLDFNKDNQEELKKLFGDMVNKGAYPILSNSNNPYIRELYKEYRIIEVMGRRCIAGDGSKRQSIKELLILGF